MAPQNGNGWTRWLVGTIWSIVVMVIMFMGNVVRINDLSNRQEHKEIISGSVKRNREQQKDIEHIKDIVTDIRLEQRSMQSDIKHTLASIERKL